MTAFQTRPTVAAALSLLAIGGAVASTPREARAAGGGDSGFSMGAYNLCRFLGNSRWDCFYLAIQLDPVGDIQRLSVDRTRSTRTG
jgi:hypothetical protein